MVHIHKSLGGIHIGGHHHRRDANKKGVYKKGRDPEMDSDRTWAIACDPACEKRILADIEFSSSHPGGVPLTGDEEALKQDLESAAQVETARMSQALAGMVKERIQSGKAEPAGAKVKA